MKKTVRCEKCNHHIVYRDMMDYLDRKHIGCTRCKAPVNTWRWTKKETR